MYLQMEPTPPTGCARLAVPEHIPRVPTKIHVFAPAARTSLSTERAPRIAFAAVVRLEYILRMLTNVPAPCGPLALQVKRYRLTDRTSPTVPLKLAQLANVRLAPT